MGVEIENGNEFSMYGDEEETYRWNGKKKHKLMPDTDCEIWEAENVNNGSIIYYIIENDGSIVGSFNTLSEAENWIIDMIYPIKNSSNPVDADDYGYDDYEDDEEDTFIENGHEYRYIEPHGDIAHLDFDSWQVWECQDIDTGEEAYFVIDNDTKFIDWGPCDTLEEAEEFLQGKIDDYNSDELEESCDNSSFDRHQKIRFTENSGYKVSLNFVYFEEPIDGRLTIKESPYEENKYFNTYEDAVKFANNEIEKDKYSRRKGYDELQCIFIYDNNKKEVAYWEYGYGWDETELNEKCNKQRKNKNNDEEELEEVVTKKSNGKWANVGKSKINHGEFDTREEADKQRKAMCANWDK